MNVNEIILQLNTMACEKYKKNVVRMGIPEENCIGVSTIEIRKLAPKIGKSNDLAWELWNTGYHEAKILAVLLFEKKKVDLNDINILMKSVHSWDLCDHICKNLIIKLPDYKDLIWEWRENGGTYYRRAVFTLIASVSVHEKTIIKEDIDEYFRLICECADDSSEHVKKAISWALRELGKIDFDYAERAIEVAYELIDSPSKNCRWVGKDALKELETLVKVDGRSRLISSNTAMGKNLC